MQYTLRDYEGEFNILVMEKLTIKHYIEKTNFTKKKISEILGITEPTLSSKIKRHNLK